MMKMLNYIQFRMHNTGFLSWPQIGGNKMFKMLYDSNFTYDSSMPVYENRPPSWPYTLDYKIFHDCMIPPCPTRSYPGRIQSICKTTLISETSLTIIIYIHVFNTTYQFYFVQMTTASKLYSQFRLNFVWYIHLKSAISCDVTSVCLIFRTPLIVGLSLESFSTF